MCVKAPGHELRGAIQASPWKAGSETAASKGVVVMGIQVRGSKKRRAMDSARLLKRRNGAATDQKTAADFIRPSAGRGKCPRQIGTCSVESNGDGSADSAPDQAAGKEGRAKAFGAAVASGR